MFTVASSAALYHRAWEFLLPQEASHGPARLSLSQSPTLQHDYGSFGVHFPDGRFWSGNIGFSISSPFQVLANNWRMAELSGGSGFLGGTNWISVADCMFDTVGIQKDGTLWISRKPLPREFSPLYKRKIEGSSAQPFPPEKFGGDNDWKSAVSYGRFALLLKTNGTLWAWAWGWKANDPTRANWPGLSALKLAQVGSDSDWAEIRQFSSRVVYARKKDGRIWSN